MKNLINEITDFVFFSPLLIPFLPVIILMLLGFIHFIISLAVLFIFMIIGIFTRLNGNEPPPRRRSSFPNDNKGEVVEINFHTTSTKKAA